MTKLVKNGHWRWDVLRENYYPKPWAHYERRWDCVTSGASFNTRFKVKWGRA